MTSLLLSNLGASPAAYGGRSVGITGATTSQAIVVTKAKLDPTFYRYRCPKDEERKTQGDAWTYPRGSIDCHDADQSELAFAVLDTPANQYHVVPNDIQLTITTCLNGRGPQTGKLSFRGVVTAPGWVSKATSDFGLTIKSSGTETVINSGPEPIPEGSLVVWAYPPKDRALWHKRRGKPDDKVVPELRAWNGERLSLTWTKLLKRLDDEFAPRDGEDGDEYCTRLFCFTDRQLIQLVRRDDPLQFDGGDDDGGWHNAAWAAGLCALALRAQVTTAPDAWDEPDPQPADTPVLDKWISTRSAVLCREAFAVAGMSMPAGFHARLSKDAPALDGLATTRTFVEMATRLMGVYADQMRARVVGKALSSALPGKQLDIFIGATDFL